MSTPEPDTMTVRDRRRAALEDQSAPVFVDGNGASQCRRTPCRSMRESEECLHGPKIDLRPGELPRKPMKRVFLKKQFDRMEALQIEHEFIFGAANDDA